MFRRPSGVFAIVFSAIILSSAEAADVENRTTHASALRALLGAPFADEPKSSLDAHRPPFSFVYAGKSSRGFLSSWETVVTAADPVDGRQRNTITYTDSATGLQAIYEATLFTDFPALEWVLHFRNAGKEDTPTLDGIQPLDLTVPVPKDGKTVLHHSKGSQATVTDFLPIESEVINGADIKLASEGGRSSDGAMPFFNLQWPDGGIVGAIGWSGQWAMELRRPEPDKLTLQAGQQTTHFVLHPGESIRTPSILLLRWQGDDRMRGHNLFRRLLMAHLLPRRNGEVAVPPVAWNAFFAFSDPRDINVSEENQLDWIGRIAPLGAEAYWLDAGWFEGGWPHGIGNLKPKAKQFPRGLRPLADAAHQNAMKFVLWFEPERTILNNEVAREHPEWVLQSPAIRGHGIFNLGDPAARRWMTDYLAKCIDDWDVDVFRIDCNVVRLPFWKANDAPDRQGITENRYIEGLYELWDELVRRRPQLLIDNCASGGRRIDLETIRRSYTLTRADTDIEPIGAEPWSVACQNHTAGLSLYVPQHTGLVLHFDPYRFRSQATMGACLSMDVRAKDLPAELVKQAIREVEELRPLYFGDYYPLISPGPSDEAWCGWQFDRPELGRGFAMLFRRPKASDSTVTIGLRGLDPEASYEVELRETFEAKEKQTLTGATLARLGIAINSAPGSMLVIYHKIGEKGK